VDIDFDSLIQLQTLDEKIRNTSLFLEDAPSRIKAIDKEIEDSAQILSQAKEKMVQNQKRRRTLETQVQDIKVKISKYKQQLNNVKTNIEYRSLLKEIDEAQVQIESLEEKIISDMLVADDIEEEIKEAEKKANEIKNNLSKEKEAFLGEKKEKEETKKRLESEKEKLIPVIPSDLLNLYQQIFGKNNGISLSAVTDDFCSMCQIRIRPQILNELIAQSTIILCENCGRILYWKKKSS
jgi:predicted  nucleic acid-binding Zn-ribbon protein